MANDVTLFLIYYEIELNLQILLIFLKLSHLAEVPLVKGKGVT